MLTSHMLDLVLWCAHPLLQAAVAVSMWRHRLHKQFPAFFAYLLSQIVIFSAIFPFRSHYTWFFWVYWIGAAVNVVLSFMIIHEIFLDIFRPYHNLKDFGTVVFKWAGVVMLLVAVVVAFSNSADRGPLMHAVITLQRSARVVQFGLVVFLLLFSRFLGVSRRQFSFGIALGFGCLAGIELLLLAMESGSFLKHKDFNFLNMAVYNLAIITWFTYSFSRVGARRPAANPLQTQRWEQGLVHAQQAVAPDSLIPMFESMVERAITRSSSLDEAQLTDLPFPEPKAFSAASTGTGSKRR